MALEDTDLKPYVMASTTYLHEPSGITILPLLTPHLPTTLPLVRRIQFHHRSPYSHILASFPPFTSTLPPCYVVAFCDLSRAPETEMWIFCSLELSTYSLSDVSPPQSSDRQQETKECTRHLLSLLEKLRTLDVPPTTDSSIDGSTVLVGSLHERTLRLLQDHANGKVIKTNHGPYAKYIFSTQTHPPSSQPPLPSNLVFAPLRPEHFPLVLSRTSIPRKARTLLLCPSMGIFPTSPTSDPDSTTSPPPIAWVFLSPDGSIASLHCEETHRGRGLARAVTCKLFETGISSFASDGLAHADVDMENLASQGLCKSLGAKEAWEVYWTRIDLGAISQGEMS